MPRKYRKTSQIGTSARTSATIDPDEAPLQAELFSVSQLEEHALGLAVEHELTSARARAEDRLLPRLDANERALAAAYAMVTAAMQRGRSVTPAAEWFIDNFHLIEEQIRTARRHLPRAYSRELPRVRKGSTTIVPRAYILILEFIAHSHGHLDTKGLRAFLASYQSTRPLRLGELWAVPIMLRLALIENLRLVIDHVIRGQRDREAARTWVARMSAIAASAPAEVVLVLAEMVAADPPLTQPFMAELATQLQGQGPGLVFPMTWLEQRLAERGLSVEQVFQLASQSQAIHQVAVSNSIASLRLLSATDWRAFVEAISLVEDRLAEDPAGVYATMDFATRDRYRHVVEAIAKGSRLSEEEVAAAAVRLARSGEERRAHVGYFLVGVGRIALERETGRRRTARLLLLRSAHRFRLALYIGSILGLSVAVTWFLGWAAYTRGLDGWALGVAVALLAVATSQLTTAIVQWAATLLAPASILPRLDFSTGIPAENRAVVAVPTLLTERDEVDGLLDSLEVRYLANRDPNLAFALLSDFRDAPREHMDGDEALLERARAGIQALNARYLTAGRSAPFYLFHRARRWNPREGVWMGWERKRGKLEQFNEALRGATGLFSTIVGDPRRLRDVKYVIALDSDTQLPRDAARELVAIMAHPLNRPRFDAGLSRVVDGHAILQPRVAITMLSTRRSRFARLFAGEPGIDPYTRAVSDVYQDVFDEGSFVGKGIYDVDAFQQAIGGKLPENRILSHDLLEGSYARSGLVSDVLVFEDYPAAYSVEVSRRHRWTRGDWQLLAWLGHRVPTHGSGRVSNHLSLLSRWKIADNLRRSMLPLATLALLVLGWARADFAGPTTAVVIVILVVPGLLIAMTGLLRRPLDLSRRHHLRELSAALGTALAREGFALACLPHDARVSASAIIRAAGRVYVTGRRLLEWRTASDAQRGARYGLVPAYRLMIVSPVAAVVVTGVLLLEEPGSLPFAAPIALAWALAPALVWWLSRPTLDRQAPLTAADELFLRRVARRTWRFFETFVSAGDNYLPPDNFQEDPPQGIAHRTSPTNIGLALTANLAAYDFGYVTAGEVLGRSARTMATMGRLDRYRGHFYNWYDTRTLEPLRPMYVSTVDSGNLTGHLRVLATGLGELADGAIFRPTSLAGLVDTLDVIAELEPEASEVAVPLDRLRAALVTPPPGLRAARGLLEHLRGDGAALLAFADTRAPGELADWAGLFAAQVAEALAELDLLAPWLSLEDPPPGATEGLGELAGLDAIPTLRELAALERSALPTRDPAGPAAAPPDPLLEELRRSVHLGASRALARLAELERLMRAAIALAEVEVEFLYDRERHLLAIGYHVGDHRRGPGFYDLLASEARLASFVAIADGKLPPEHWFSLGRSLTTTVGKPALLSWSGSMFEYLMPLLVMPTYRGTLLDETCRSVVARQIEYGRERGVPWGVSESGYNKTDAELNYQYMAFGVPGLGFKRGLAAELVVAPYASAMALMIAPQRACDNLRRLALAGLLGPHGFYEAIDYTPARLPRGEESVTIASYMAHHQGMAFLSLVYLLEARPMQRRFAADPAFRATDLLLQERVPRAPAIYPHPAEVTAGAETSAPETDLRVFPTANTPSPEVQLLSNGTYHVMVTNAGGGYSRWRDLAVTRWHEDLTTDGWGSFCYLRDVESGDFWSTTHQPSRVRAASYEAIFSQGRAEFRRRDDDIETHVEICVSPEDDIELRRVCLTNCGQAPRTIELTSYAEVVLATPAADASHPAYSNLFVETEVLRDRQAIVCTRRPRSGTEEPPWVIHLMTVQGRLAGAPSYATGRGEFLGRGRSVGDPQALHRPALSGSEGAVLDPALAIRNTVALETDEVACINIITGVAATRAAALALIDKYSDRHASERVLELSWTHSKVLLRRLDASAADTRLYQRLASHILYTSPALRAPASVLARNQRGQSALWAYGISGDLPIALLRIGDRRHLGLARQMVQAHAYFRLKGLAVDLVIWNEDPSGYRQVLHEELLAVVTALSEADLIDRPGGIFVRRSDQIAEEDKVLLQTVARLIISDGAGSLEEQLGRHPAPEVKVPVFVPRGRQAARTPVRDGTLERTDLSLWNGRGGFTADGREYVITSSREAQTPAPWVNVLANPYFGTVVSERGAAYTWCENAHSYRLTPWHNDPVGDASGEAFFLRDEDSGRFWSPTPGPAPGRGGYTTRHGFGYSVFAHDDDGIASELQTFVATDAPIKFIAVKLTNHSGRSRRLSLTGIFEMVLGERRAETLAYVVTEVDLRSGALLARNAYASEFSSRVAFLDCSEERRSLSGDRLECIGRNRDLAQPACMGKARLSGRVGAGLDPCMAMQVRIDLADGQEREVVFTFGSGIDRGDARTLIHRFRGVDPAHAALSRVWEYWKRTLGAVQVETPDPGFNFLANGWLLYQVLASRIWGRSGFYQSGGAFGFRDQLQDAMALVHAEPQLLRQQIVLAAGRQFCEGDVQHWWHPPLGRGVRTRISDDYLWLPYAVCRYITAVGESGILDERAHYLEGRAVKSDEDSYYDLPLRSEAKGTVYEHCVRAIENGLRFGERGLPLIGCGDWNDGMNLVGEHGKGESVWLAFFLHDVLMRFVPVASARGDDAFAERCRTTAASLSAAIDAHGWDGAWYRRAYFDNGEALGSASSLECQIDSLPQSWAILTGAGDPARARLGLAALHDRLVNHELGLIQLFDPPFDRSEQNPGYVKGYVPGVRENGGQYTHAAVWAVMAFAAAGEVARAWELFNLISPVRHGESAAAIAQYKVEPYVVAADVYTNPQHPGRGGWTWYTGSAAWMYRLQIESLLGLHLEVDHLRLDPRLPAGWGSFTVHYRYRETIYHIAVHGPAGGGQGVHRLVCDGVDQPGERIPLIDDRADHRAQVWLHGLEAPGG